MKRNQQEVIDRILDLLTELVDDAPVENRQIHRRWKCSRSRNAPKRSGAFPSIPSANWSRKAVSATSVPVRASAGKSSSASNPCSTISEVRNNKAPAAADALSINKLFSPFLCNDRNRTGHSAVNDMVLDIRIAHIRKELFV